MNRLLAPTLAGLVAFTIVLAPALAQTQPAAPAFIETYDGTPAQPQAYITPGWSTYIQGFDQREAAAGASIAQHGPNCEPPGFPYDAANSHAMRTAADAVFICNGHLMTAPGLAGYSAVYMTPPALADFSQGATTIRWDMSTLRTSARDWIDIVLSPYAEHQELAYNNNDQHIPPHNIHVELAGGGNVMIASQRIGGGAAYGQGRDASIPGISTTWDDVFRTAGMTQSGSRRDTFEIRLTDTRISVCLPGYQRPQGGVFCWINTALPERLDPAVWGGLAAVQFNHRVYNAEKACNEDNGQPQPWVDQWGINHSAYGDLHCPPNTWHWDNVSIQPYVPFQIIPNEVPMGRVRQQSPSTVRFTAPSPAGAMLSFVSFSNTPDLAVSFDGGSTWQAPRIQPARAPKDGAAIENGEYVFTPMPEGAQSVMVRTTNGYLTGVSLEDFAIFGPPGGQVVPVPTSLPTATSPPVATIAIERTPSATATPTAAATATETPAPTATAAPTPTTTAPEPDDELCRVLGERNGEPAWLPVPCL